jgi:hypothetical protein
LRTYHSSANKLETTQRLHTGYSKNYSKNRREDSFSGNKRMSIYTQKTLRKISEIISIDSRIIPTILLVVFIFGIYAKKITEKNT